jgi:hypothetical protein
MRAAAAAVALAVAGAIAASASAGGESTLQLNATLAFVEQGNTATTCPPGTPDSVACFPTTATGLIPGLGEVSESYLVVREDNETPCNHVRFTATLTVAGKGAIDLDAGNPGCLRAQDTYQTFSFTITGGTGIYAGVSGSGTIAASYTSSGIATSKGKEAWTGSITVPALTFDVTPPAIAGATSRTLTAKTAVRVRYAVTAVDIADGPRPVACLPPSGARFAIGRTPVTCTATDSSGNTATAHFAVTVKRPRK